MLDAFGALMANDFVEAELPPIVEFDMMYCRGAHPYPRQSTILKIVFLEIEELTDYDHMVIAEWLESTRTGGDVIIPLDIYERMEWCRDNGYRHFSEFIYCGGRRSGKGFLGGKMGAYLTAQMIAKGSPQRYYGIDESKSIYLDVFATQYSQAQDILFADVRDAILANEWISPYVKSSSNERLKIQTPYDKVREETMVGSRKGQIRNEMASIILEPHASNTSVRGRASFMQCFDEFAHGLDGDYQMTSKKVYDAATPSLQQLGKDGFVYVPSSPWSKTGKFYDLYDNALKTDQYGKSMEPHKFVFKAPSWEMYKDWEYDRTKKKALILPPEVSLEMKAKEEADPETFDVEFRANFANTENAFLNSTKVDAAFAPFPPGDDRNFEVEHGKLGRSYRAHADAGRSQDNFCFAMGHAEEVDGYLHAFIDLTQVWQAADFPEEDGVKTIDYNVPVEWMAGKFKTFSVGKFTMDQWNSAYVLDTLRKRSRAGEFMNGAMAISVDNHSPKENYLRWQAFKTALYQGWVHVPEKLFDVHGLGNGVCLAKTEMKFLKEMNGKVDHPKCHDSMTEVLTDEGWKLFAALTGKERIATLTEDFEVEWHVPNEIYREDRYEGRMYEYSSRLVDFCVTPGHVMLYRRKGKVGRATIEDLCAEGGTIEVPVAGLCDSRRVCKGQWACVNLDKVDVGFKGSSVHCANVPNHTMLTRRHGRTLWSGNSGPWCHNDMVDCISTVVYDLLKNQVTSFLEGSLTKVVGGAQGGYMTDGNSFVYGTNRSIEEDLRSESKSYWETCMGGSPWGW